MRVYTEAQRHLVFANANAIDESRAFTDSACRERAAERADLLIPLTKAS